MWLSILAAVLSCYFLGNLNGAVSVSMMLGHEDVRKKGSGNAGLTNFVRNYGFASAGIVALIDMGKAFLACLLGKLLLEPFGYSLEGAVLGAVAVSLGHDFPALLGFRGGKGILSGFAVAIALDYRCALIILAVFAIVFLLTRYVSLASLLASFTLGVYFALMYWNQPLVMAGGIFLSALAIFMHRSNIVRLCKGTENRMQFRKKETAE